MSKYTVYEVQAQSLFCKGLMLRLDNDIQKAKEDGYGMGIEKHTQMQADAVRLRRELNKLRQMLYPWG